MKFTNQRSINARSTLDQRSINARSTLDQRSINAACCIGFGVGTAFVQKAEILEYKPIDTAVKAGLKPPGRRFCWGIKPGADHPTRALE